MMMLALKFLDLFLKPKANPFSWGCALGSLFMLMGVIFGLYFAFEYFVPFWGHFTTGMVLSGSLFLIGGILILTARRKKPTPVLTKTLNTLKDKADDLHLKEAYDTHKELILATSLVAGLLLPLFSKLRKGPPSKVI